MLILGMGLTDCNDLEIRLPRAVLLIQILDKIYLADLDMKLTGLPIFLIT